MFDVVGRAGENPVSQKIGLKILKRQKEIAQVAFP
jgi:hypothetical protein